jgi:predicted MPP superfamily phosphohydrolase
MYHHAPMSRVALIVAVVLALFLAFNVITVWALIRLHPRRKSIVIALATIGNVMWCFFPLLNARTDFSRAIRAIFGPPWFAWLCFAMVYSVFIALAALVLRRRSRIRIASRLFLWITLGGLVVGVYGALVPLRVEHVPIALKNLPPQLDGFRIALIADLHVGLFSRSSRLRQIFDVTRAQSPDVVVLGGDLIDDDPYFTPKLLASIPSDLSPLAVLGNHEMYGEPMEMIARLRGSRVRLLVNDATVVRGLCFAGISDYAARTAGLKPNIPAALARCSAPSFPILLSHQPRAFPEAQQRNIALTLCAHSHGGQCGFRPLRWSLAGLFLPYHMGLYRRGESQLYVNTGTGYWLLPWRLGITPEITLIELRRR